MKEEQEPGSDRPLRYPLTWPAWLAERVTEAANAKMTSVAAWLREAAMEKLDREKKRGRAS